MVLRAPVRLTSKTSRKRWSVISARERSGMLVPAALIRASMRLPERWRIVATIDSTADLLAMSQGWGCMRPCASAGASEMVFWRASGRRARRATSQLAEASAMAVARPTPEEAPVMIAVLVGMVVGFGCRHPHDKSWGLAAATIAGD